MARGRMLSKSISISEKVNKIFPEKMKAMGFTKFTHGILLYTWLLPHSDDWGRMDGSTFWIKRSVVPDISINEDEIEIILKCLKEVNLINLYKVNEKRYIQIIDFENHQVGLTKRTTSKFPEFQGNS